jgi:ferritin-like protein
VEIIYIFGRVIAVSNEQNLKDQIIEKAWTDAEFKSKLLADPKSAIKDAFGVDIPEDVQVDVLEETSNKYYLVLPQNPSDTNNVEGPAWA